MKRRKPIDHQGHKPHPGGAQAVEECAKCHDVHVKGLPWKRPCPPSAANAHERTYRGE